MGDFTKALRIQAFLKPYEHAPDLFRAAQIGNGISNSIVVFEPEQGREFFLIQFIDAFLYVLR